MKSTLTLLTLFLLALLASLQAAEVTKKPNVVFILADDLGVNDISLYGSTFHETPHIDALAKRGMKFNQAYSASPLCSPTRSSILTGVHPARTGITAPECHLPKEVLDKHLVATAPPMQKALTAESVTRLSTNYFTLAKAFKANGYVTAHFGKWHLGPEPFSPLQHGFDSDIPHAAAPSPLGKGFFYPFPVWKNHGKPGDNLEDLVCDEAVTFIEQHKDKPFFLNYWAFEVHSPWQAKDKQIDKYRAKVDPKSLQRNPVYAGMIETLDEVVGRLVAALDKAGVLDNTIIVFTSDNGPYFIPNKEHMPAEFSKVPVTSAQPLRAGKGTIYEAGTRVPLIVIWPGKVKPGTETSALMQSTDFFPTFAEMLGWTLPTDVHFDGVSLRPLLEKNEKVRDELFCHFPHAQARGEFERMPAPTPATPASSVRQGDWKLIRFYCDNVDQRDRYELYNVAEDPGERNDLTALHPERVKQLAIRIDHYLKDAEAVIPKPNPAYTVSAPKEWQISHDTQLTEKDGALVVTSTGKDPWLATRDLPSDAQGPFTIRLRMKSSGSGSGMLYFATEPNGGFSQKQMADFPLQHDSAFHDYDIKIPAMQLSALRLDPGNAPGAITITLIAVLDHTEAVVKAWGTPVNLGIRNVEGRSAVSDKQDKNAKPNILFILTEDQGAQLGFVGTPGIQTPNMDSLARSGVYFNNAFVGYPVCSASKACIYTALHNHANGILNNTQNYHKPVDQLTEVERNNALYQRNRIGAGIPTLIERLHEVGYYQGVMHKLHVAPVEKFPYDEFIPGENGEAVAGFIDRAIKTGKPWHLFFNIGVSHRPFPNSDKRKIRVKPEEVKLPAFLPDTPVVRQDWAEYLAAIENADQLVGEGLEALRASGEEANTIVVFLGDHGPCFQHGKMTLYDFGLRTPLIIRVPGLKGGFRTDALVSSLDLTPTLLDLLGLPPLAKSHGVSLRPALESNPEAKGRALVCAEISDRGMLPNAGMQERSVCDGRWHLIYREHLVPPWRQVQADSKEWPKWGNRTYAETVRVKDQFPEQYRILVEMDPQSLGGTVPALELYDLQTDPDEMHNLANSTAARPQRDRLYAALRQWVRDTADPAVQPPPTPPE